MAELVTYSWAVCTTIIGAIGLISTFVWIAEMTTPLRVPKVPPRYLGIVAFVCLSVAQFEVWYFEHTARIEAESTRTILPQNNAAVRTELAALLDSGSALKQDCLKDVT